MNRNEFAHRLIVAKVASGKVFGMDWVEEMVQKVAAHFPFDAEPGKDTPDYHAQEQEEDEPDEPKFMVGDVWLDGGEMHAETIISINDTTYPGAPIKTRFTDQHGWTRERYYSREGMFYSTSWGDIISGTTGKSRLQQCIFRRNQ